jgi:hypothetical protein
MRGFKEKGFNDRLEAAAKPAWAQLERPRRRRSAIPISRTAKERRRLSENAKQGRLHAPPTRLRLRNEAGTRRRAARIEAERLADETRQGEARRG